MIQWKVKTFSCGIPPQGIHPVVARLLSNRGVDGENAARFLSEEKGEWFSPSLLPDIEPAAERIRRAVSSGEKITIYGDYDVDGVSSVALLTRFFASLGVFADRYIPDRKEGYGLNVPAIDRIAASGCSLMITVDTGTTAAEEIAYAKNLGMDVVVTDHHECGGDLPDCPVVNPKRPDSRYPFSGLAGVGVVFKLVCFLSFAGLDALFSEYGEYVALGTVADIMPLVSENRMIVARGLLAMKHPSVGLLALKNLCSEEDLGASAVAFRIAPRLNAAGRIGSASSAVDLLLCDDPNKARSLAEFLCEENDLRRRTESEIFSDVEEKISRRNLAEDPIIIEISDTWHDGVIGIVASRIVEKYSRPCILFRREGDLAKGSARSVPAVNLYELIAENAGLLTRFGGHSMAAGMTLRADDFETFRAAMEKSAAEISEEALLPLVEADCALEDEYLNVDFCRELKRLEPFGAGNPLPSFYIGGLTVASVDGVSSGKHTRITFQTASGSSLKAMMFSVCPLCAGCLPGDRAEIICTVSENVFRGVSSVSASIKSLNLPDYEALFSEEEKLWENYRKTGAIPSEITRSDVAAVYRAVRHFSKDRPFVISPTIFFRAASTYGEKIGYLKCRLCLEVLSELDLIRCSFSPVKVLKEGFWLRIEPKSPEKKDLTCSETFRKVGRCQCL